MPEPKPPHPSYWIQSTEETDYPPLMDGVSVDVAVIGAGITGRLGPADAGSPDELGNGEGGIFRVGGRKRAVYREARGGLHVLSPVCRHLGCIVSWNRAERTWDCPCHGSRYTREGRIIQGPAVQDLKRV